MPYNRLDYVALASRAPEATADFLGRQLGLERRAVAAGKDGPKLVIFAVGQTQVAVFPLGHPLIDGSDKPGVHHIALAADDLARARKEVESVGLMAESGEETGLGSRRRFCLDPAFTAGIRTYLSEPLDLASSSSAHVERIDHLGVASADNEGGLLAFRDRLGCPLESQQTDMEVSIAVESFTSDKYGAVYHTRAPELVGGLRSWFVTVGDCELELLQDFDPDAGGTVRHGTPGNTRQDRGAISRFVESRGAGLHHIAFKTPDINKLLPALQRDGTDVIDHIGRPGSRRAMIGFVQPKSIGGVLVHFVER